ncbi:hypothetical protein A2960_02290 [Candidatus Gottesmanbacteria bacterium RIFCSPLOWO2_01_FULL_39_12b]|uniref:O-antigen ligase-related domain-containing protein n=1 Tax=Candidatus Gottesmanbacteria bacterium RIFCSPLOWO2_01_FULL_39_12b TaxID=1798388 RepID=A0A1F6AR38_9BACT|nr:MAG: hypothetical protein A2960_02290 [Candidatus Gottesmanbacteria bacterium RIFCSPLOWO2_01_FULL_39_12b]
MRKELQSLKLLHFPSKLNKIYFFLGLVIFYLVCIISPNKPVYFSAYIISTFFFYLSSKNIRLSLVYSLILSLFSEIGVGASWFIMEPKEFNLGAGFWVSPTTILILILLPLSLSRKIKKVKVSDFVLLLFFLWNIVSFLVYPYNNVFYGVLRLTETMIVYYLVRIYITKENSNNLSPLLISMLLFQIITGSLQFFQKRPLGLLAESVTVDNPLGITAIEEESLFRLTGTFGHPNFLASFLLTVIPFVWFYPLKNKYINLIGITSLLILFFTYSRAAWIITGMLLVPMIISLYNQKKYVTRKIVALLLTAPFGLILFLFPFFQTRLATFPQAFEETGSVGIRVKLLEEGLNLISQYPITGVGLNRSAEVYFTSPFTDFVKRIKPDSFYKIHNTFVEIASEVGIPGLIFFIIFLYSIFRHYQNTSRTYFQKAAVYGLMGLTGISMLNPFFHTSQFPLFFLLSAFILV